MKRFLCTFLSWGMLLAAFPASAVESTGLPVTQNFTTTTAEYPNPERGWYRWIGSQYCDGANAGSLDAAYAAGSSLTLCILNLSAYRTNPTLGSDIAATVTSMAALVRSKGMKVVLRPAYNYDNTGLDATTAITLGHVAQLAEVFRENADVLAYPQAGFFGPFGEHWSGSGSSALVRTDAERLQLKNALLQAHHPRHSVGFRYPAHINTFFPSQMTANLHTTGAGQDRIGFYQDCIGADDSEGGTYTGLTDAKRARVANDTQYLPYGGETCTGSAPKRDCPWALTEGAKSHWTYQNRSFDNTFHNSWISGGCYDQITRLMGYRFEYRSLTHQSTAAPGQTVTFNVDMRNVGWSRIFSARRLQVRLMTPGGTLAASSMSYVDLRKLAPQMTANQKIPVQVVAPAAGTYNVVLCIPDVWAKTAANARYYVRPGNADAPGAWNGTTGCFSTATSVAVS